MNLGDLALHGIGNIGGSSGVIDDIQTGTTSFAGSDLEKNIAITAADLSKSIVLVNNVAGTAVNSAQVCLAPSFNTDSEINIKRVFSGGTIASVKWTVVQFKNVKSVQRGQSGTDSATITAVDLSKSILFVHWTNANDDVYASVMRMFYELSDSTTVTIQDKGGNQFYYQVLEFK